MPEPKMPDVAASEPHAVKFIARRVSTNAISRNHASPEHVGHYLEEGYRDNRLQGKVSDPEDSAYRPYRSVKPGRKEPVDPHIGIHPISSSVKSPGKRIPQVNPSQERLRTSRLVHNAGHVGKGSGRRPKNFRPPPASGLKRAISNTYKTGSIPFEKTPPRKLRGHVESKYSPQSPGNPDQRSEASADPSDISANGSDSSLSMSPDAMETNDNPNGDVEVLLQPQTRPITLEQLVIEVRTIYEVVVQFEDKAIRLDEEHTLAAKVDPAHRAKMTKDDYMSYIALHKALLHEHHDLCLASQHPAASESLRQLPGRYSIPARMWRHGVHAPLEVLRMRLPESREHMIAFILISFNHMTLFLETVPQFEATWLECIGDLGRYRLALAETDEEREMFSGIARDWYSRAIQLNPQISRLYHHCAILAPSFSMEQLSLYGRALTGAIPFLPTRKSITALFRPVLAGDEQLTKQISRPTFTILRAHAALALGGAGSRAEFNHCLAEIRGGLFLQLFADSAQQQQDAKRLAAHMAIAASASMLQYGITRGNGASASILRLALGVNSHNNAEFEGAVASTSNTMFAHTIAESLTARELASARITVKASCLLAFEMFEVALKRPKDEDLHPFIHVMFVLILSFTNAPRAMSEIESIVPWHTMSRFLNAYSNAASMSLEICSSEFPANAGGYSQALPEDYMLQGLIFAKNYLPDGWTDSSNPDLTEQAMEPEYGTAVRLQRVLWAGHKISECQKWMFFDNDTREFSADSTMEGLQTDEDEADFVPLLPDTSFG